MAFHDRVRVTTQSTGIGDLALGPATFGFRTFAEAGVVDGETVRYLIEELGTGRWEIGSGVYDAETNTISRGFERSSIGVVLSLVGGAVVSNMVAADDIVAPEELSDAVAAEAGLRTAADQALGGRIDTEISDRQTAVANEASVRTSADTALGGRIDTEISDRTAAVSAEATARANADTALQGNINAEASARTAADTALGGRIDTEVSDRQAAVSGEATARANADALLIPLTQKGAANGVATLGSDSKIPAGQLPDLSQYALLAGAAFTGGITGTTASFSGNISAGSNAAAVSSATPINLNLGGTYASTAGDPAKIKLKLFDHGGVVTEHYGVGVSAGRFEFHAASAATYSWYRGGVKAADLDGTGLSVTGTGTFSGSLKLGSNGDSATATPLTIDMGGQYSTVAGANLKLKIYQGPTSYAGIGVSGVAMDYVVGFGGTHDFYTGVTPALRASITATGLSVTGTGTFSGNVALGSTAVTVTASPISLSLGGSVSSTAGASPKLIVWDPGTEKHGIGISNNQLDYIAGNASTSHAFYVAGTKYAAISNTGLSVTGTGTFSGAVTTGGDSTFGNAASSNWTTFDNNNNAQIIRLRQNGTVRGYIGASAADAITFYDAAGAIRANLTSTGLSVTGGIGASGVIETGYQGGFAVGDGNLHGIAGHEAPGISWYNGVWSGRARVRAFSPSDRGAASVQGIRLYTVASNDSEFLSLTVRNDYNYSHVPLHVSGTVYSNGLSVTGTGTFTGDITTSGSTNAAINIRAANASSPQIRWGNTAGTYHWSIYQTLGAGGEQGNLNFYDYTGAANRMTLTPGGNLTVTGGLTIPAPGELLVNRGFDSNLSSWSATNATWSAGTALLSATAGGGSATLGQSFATVIGKTYRLAYQFVGGNTGNSIIRVGTSLNNFSIINTAMGSGPGVFETTFVATAATTWVTLFVNYPGVDITGQWDWVSVSEVRDANLGGRVVADQNVTIRNGGIYGGFTCVGVGVGTLARSTHYWNTAVGYLALSSIVAGEHNTAVGANALKDALGAFNTAVGSNMGSGLTSGNYNVLMGTAFNVGGAATGNVVLSGYGPQNYTASHSVILGQDAGVELTTGGGNTLIGHQAGRGITTGTGNTIIGSGPNSYAAGLTNNIALCSGGSIRYQFDGTSHNFTGDITASGKITAPAAFRSTGSSGLSGGPAAEVVYFDGKGFFTSFDRSTNTHRPTVIDGSTVTIQAGGADKAVISSTAFAIVMPNGGVDDRALHLRGEFQQNNQGKWIDWTNADAGVRWGRAGVWWTGDRMQFRVGDFYKTATGGTTGTNFIVDSFGVQVTGDASTTGGVKAGGAIRSTGNSGLSGGPGVELHYSGDEAHVTGFNRDNGTYRPLVLDGSTTLLRVAGSTKLEAHTTGVNVAGNFHATGTSTSSDARLKEAVEPITGALDTVCALEGVRYTLKDSGQRSAGVIAQQVEPHTPELVSEQANETLGYNYNGLSAYLIEAIKELRAENAELRAMIEAMKGTDNA